MAHVKPAEPKTFPQTKVSPVKNQPPAHKEAKFLRLSVTEGFWYKLRTFVLYCLLAMLPVLFIFLYFFQDISRQVEDEMLSSSMQSLIFIANSIDRDISDAMNLANRVYANEALYSLTQNTHENKARYFTEYQRAALPFFSSLMGITQSVADFSVYTDNPSVPDGGYIRRIDHALAQEYPAEAAAIEEILESSQSLMFLEYANSTAWLQDAYNVPFEGMFAFAYGRNYPHHSPGALFSFIRDMSHGRGGEAAYKAIIKIDFQTDYFNNVIEQHGFRGIISITNAEGQIVSLNGPADIWLQYIQRRDSTRFIQQVALSSPRGFSVVGYCDISYIQNRLATQRNLASSLIAISCLVLLLVVYRLVNDVFNARYREAQIELRRQQAEFSALKNQVDPHFLFNVLETVRMKLFLEGQKAHSIVIMRMARLYRKLLDWDADVILLADEVAFIRGFLAIQKYRYDEALVYTLDTDDDFGTFRVPKMLLQTFIENACKHGLNDNAPTVFDISVRIVDDVLFFIIKDNGPGFSNAVKERIQQMLDDETSAHTSHGIGIANTISRMRLYYGDNFSFVVADREQGEQGESMATGAVVSLVLPAIKEES